MNITTLFGASAFTLILTAGGQSAAGANSAKDIIDSLVGKVRAEIPTELKVEQNLLTAHHAQAINEDPV